jgi:hypothetical protein
MPTSQRMGSGMSRMAEGHLQEKIEFRALWKLYFFAVLDVLLSMRYSPFRNAKAPGKNPGHILRKAIAF